MCEAQSKEPNVKVSCYLRPDGRLGVRNHVAIIPTVLCANEIARKIGENVDGTVVLRHTGGCTCGEDVARLERVLAGLGSHPNVVGALLVGLGCENCNSSLVAENIAQSTPWKPLDRIVIQETGVSKTIAQGTKTAQSMVRQAKQWEREETDLSGLTLALECGGSDATSGLAANPALGLAVDQLIDAGASAMFSETTEAIGADHVLAQRAVSDEVARKIVETVGRAREIMVARLAPGEHFLPPGNINGGLTTLEEKSLGCICKTGSRPITDVLDYGRSPSGSGLVLVDGTGFDIPSITGMVAGGAQIVAFTTGRGSPVGYPIAPVIKITGNPKTYERLEEIFDINAGTIVRGEEDPPQVGQRIFQQILATAEGQPTKAEQFGFADFSIATIAGAHAGM